MNVITDCNAGMPNVSQMTPSVSCWTPNSRGMDANGTCDLLFVSRMEAAPAALSAIPAAKLAVGEKHIMRKDGHKDTPEMPVWKGKYHPYLKNDQKDNIKDFGGLELVSRFDNNYFLNMIGMIIHIFHLL